MACDSDQALWAGEHSPMLMEAVTVSLWRGNIVGQLKQGRGSLVSVCGMTFLPTGLCVYLRQENYCCANQPCLVTAL